MSMPSSDTDAKTYVAISGGIGGCKLVLGLAQRLGARLKVIVNTGDDFEHLGLHISPDIDTTLYTLSDRVNTQTGWGRQDETWQFMDAIAEVGGPTWFRLGDKDLALHVERTRRLHAGETLSAICAFFQQRFAIAPDVIPMSDDGVRTMVETDAGLLEFQHYFVRQQCRPRVHAVHYQGADDAMPAPGALAALSDPRLAGIIICPSNPYLSVDPILAVPGLRAAMRAAVVPIIAVSPIVGAQAIKGPTAKIMTELGVEVDARSVGAHYGGLLDGFVVDIADTGLRDDLQMPVHVTNTVMRSLTDKSELAQACIAFCEQLYRDTHGESVD